MTIRIGGKNDTAHPTVSTMDDSGATAPMSNAIPVQMTAMRNPTISVNARFTDGFPSRVPTNESRIHTLQFAAAKIADKCTMYCHGQSFRMCSRDRSVFCNTWSQMTRGIRKTVDIITQPFLPGWGALGQMQSDSQKPYGLDDTDFVVQEANGNPGIRFRQNQESYEFWR
ncbi:MAG: hypothetical protein ABGZ53_00645 [Fuerstiella sp.]